MLDVAVIAEPEVRDAAPVTHAQIAAHPVVIKLVVVGAVAEGDTTSRCRRVGVQFVAIGSVKCDRVVMYVHMVVEQER